MRAGADADQLQSGPRQNTRPDAEALARAQVTLLAIDALRGSLRTARKKIGTLLQPSMAGRHPALSPRRGSRRHHHFSAASSNGRSPGRAKKPPAKVVLYRPARGPVAGLARYRHCPLLPAGLHRGAPTTDPRPKCRPVCVTRAASS